MDAEISRLTMYYEEYGDPGKPPVGLRSILRSISAPPATSGGGLF